MWLQLGARAQREVQGMAMPRGWCRNEEMRSVSRHDDARSCTRAVLGGAGEAEEARGCKAEEARGCNFV